MRTALSIAGFDPSGGAGIQADLKTFSALKCYGMTVLTALPVQNTCGVRKVYGLPLSCIEEQLECVCSDIPPDVLKVGMLFNAEIIRLVASFVQIMLAGTPLVLDPVMCAKSGDTLLEPDAVSALRERLLPLAQLVTPNIPEAQVLSGITVNNEDDMLRCAEAILRLGPQAVLLKGGHLSGERSSDLFLTSKGARWFHAPRTHTRNSHGTGCTLSAAIAAYLAHDYDVPDACEHAKRYLTLALEGAKDVELGKGHGPVFHFHEYWDKGERL